MLHLKQKLSDIKDKANIPYWHAIFIFAAFFIMVGVSYLFVSSLEHKHLERNAESIIAYSGEHILSDLREHETALGMISETVREIIINGGNQRRIADYLTKITRYSINRNDSISQVVDIFGSFNTFGGRFLSGIGWEPSEDYIPEERFWHRLAVVNANGSVSITEPYEDAASGLYVVTFSRRIFDERGQPLGVVCLKLRMDRIMQHANEVNITEGSYGILMNREMNLIAHPERSYLGRPLHDFESFAPIANDLKEGQKVIGRKVMDYQGRSSIAFMQRLENGWYLGTLVPSGEYYSGLKKLAKFLSILGVIMATMLSVVLLRMAMRKQEADETATVAVEKLRDTEEQVQVMLDSAPLVANFWNKDFNNIETNQESVRLFDLSNKQEYIEKFHQLSPEYQPDGQTSEHKAIALVKEAFEEGYCRFEWMHQNLQGQPIPCEVTLVRVKYKGDTIVLGYTRDLRAEKATMEEMRKAEVAEQSNKAKSKFLAMMSHEIRTPMNAIIGISEIHLEDEALQPKTAEAIGRIYASANLLLSIINDILDLSKAEIGKLEVVPGTYDVASLIHDTVQLNIMRIGSKSINFELWVDPNMPSELLGDELRIKQLLNNLLSNSLKYTDSGKVKLQVSFESRSETEALLTFIVSDTGQGMTKEQIKEVFDEYSRFNLEANRAIQGTGLGLSITRHIVELMGGEISVESEPGEGTVFTVRLPQMLVGSEVLGKELAESLQQFRFISVSQIRNTQIVREPMPYGKVLIVDDVETNLYVAKGLLQPYKLTIETANNGSQAVEKIKEGKSYDVIFMDHMMPNMDGIETTKHIRDLGYTHPIVALTANAVIGQADIFLRNGFDDFVPKPIDIRNLNSLLNRMIRDKQSPEAIKEARLQYDLMKFTSQKDAPKEDPALLAVFVRDVKKMLPIIEKTVQNINTINDEDLQQFSINVHAMKSSLANIGEETLSSAARRLEVAAKAGNRAVILAETPVFLSNLQDLTERFTPVESNYGTEDEDPERLYEKLLDFRFACEGFNKKPAKDALAELESGRWSYSTKKALDSLSELLLHSDFEAAIVKTDELLEKVRPESSSSGKSIFLHDE
ncbi:MAG: response regulator [Fibromonadaceae bacterium]|jgi:signal transduction histidine kinase/DNA-binding response OmpR family regulator|nr:response regulator [Fibromonadaceae bacterium]